MSVNLNQLVDLATSGENDVAVTINETQDYLSIKNEWKSIAEDVAFATAPLTAIGSAIGPVGGAAGFSLGMIGASILSGDSIKAEENGKNILNYALKNQASIDTNNDEKFTPEELTVAAQKLGLEFELRVSGEDYQKIRQ